MALVLCWFPAGLIMLHKVRKSRNVAGHVCVLGTGQRSAKTGRNQEADLLYAPWQDRIRSDAVTTRTLGQQWNYCAAPVALVPPLPNWHPERTSWQAGKKRVVRAVIMR
jgi:hypothetical protein